VSEGSPADAVAALSADLRGWLEYQGASGARASWGAAPELPEVKASPPAPCAPPSAPTAAPATPATSLELAAGSATLPVLQAAVTDCTRCRLSAGRTQTVFGVGSPTADVMFVGEGPGFHEDQRGEPFVGKAGELLTRIINNVLRMERSDVYIANVVKCRPPNNRDPQPDEVATCSPFLWRQVELIKPVVVVALGRFAIQTLLQSTQSVGRLRGRAHPFRGSVLVPTYHPAYLLRNPADKRKVFEDMKIVRAEIEARTGRTLPPIASRRGPSTG